MIVLDASAALELLLRTPTGHMLAVRLATDRDTLHAPHLLDVEVAQVLRRLCSSRELSDRRAADALEDLRDLDLERYAHQELLPRAWELRRNVTAYDAVYLALAEALGAPLVTLDARLAASPGHRARVELLG